ncbi:hypothetical protein [Vitiosangium sp. GDMCC 1.1324]|uniref:hypothetical protein n=1 Tax=Vitiosangium sp. (strain GDMCC 1.1324) TaxID=2138576 RepID=UPI0011B77E71|nr:hypothetical protein [Vitiosangium sp. GDMCC 1.1324]
MHTPTLLRWAVVSAFLICPTARAQVSLPGFELERLDVTLGRSSIVSGNGQLLVPGGMSVALAGQYQHLPLVLRNGERRLDLVRSRASALLAGSYGVLSWLELGIQLPVVLWQKGDDPSTVGLAPLASQGLGTPVLQARFGLLSQRAGQPVDLALDLALGLPVGSSHALARDAGPRFQARATMGMPLGPLQSSLEAGVLLRSRNPLAPPSASGQALEVRLGALLATTGKKLRGELALRGAFAADASQPAIEVLAGGRLPLNPELELFALAGPGLGATPGTPIARVLLGVSFRKEPPPRMEFLTEPVPRFHLEEAQTPKKEEVRPETVVPVPTRELMPSENPST